jgi:hypothetical protein
MGRFAMDRDRIHFPVAAMSLPVDLYNQADYGPEGATPHDEYIDLTLFKLVDVRTRHVENPVATGGDITMQIDGDR